MKLVSFSYNDEVGNLEGLNLQSVNLIVGRNASGKSQTLYHIESTTDLLSEKKSYSWQGNWQLKFETDNKDLLVYSIERNHDAIISEKLTVGDTVLIDRKDTNCVVYSTTSDESQNFTPPKDKLVIHVRRDIKTYPYFEDIINWASDSYHFRFGSIISYILLNNRKLPSSVLTSVGSTDGELASDMFSRLLRNKQEDIISTMNDMGYSFTHYGTIPDDNNKEVFAYKEFGEDGPSLIEYFLSQGTLRVFILLTYVHYLLQHRDPVLLSVDDLGEGLDYQRATKLGKYIYGLCEKSNIQLIATSNDGFIMDAIPIKYWNILRRTAMGVRVLNQINSPGLFNDFTFSGLSNFDFFSSDYIDSHLR